MSTIRLVLTTALLLALGGPAIASEPPPEAHGVEGAHATEAGHAPEAEGGGHEEGAVHHVDYAGDKDSDGVPNFMDWANDKDPTDTNEEFVAINIVTHAFNLTVLLGILAWFGRRPLMDMIRTRAHDVRKELTESAKARDDAKERFQELEARLGRFEDEVAKMLVEADHDARQEELRMIERAQDAARRVGEIAQRNIRDEVTRAQVALRKEAVALAIQLAEQTLKAQVASTDQKRLAQDFLKSLDQEDGS